MTGTLHTRARHVDLDVAFSDVRAADLRWAVDLAPRAAVAELVVTVDDALSVDLRVLGASHQLRLLLDGTQVFSETVACDVTDGAPLTAATAVAGYDVEARVHCCAPTEFARRVRAIEDDLDARPDHGLLARFPGTPGAVTALVLTEAAPGRPVRWETWHTYPNTGEIVHTRSARALPGTAAA